MWPYLGNGWLTSISPENCPSITWCTCSESQLVSNSTMFATLPSFCSIVFRNPLGIMSDSSQLINTTSRVNFFERGIGVAVYTGGVYLRRGRYGWLWVLAEPHLCVNPIYEFEKSYSLTINHLWPSWSDHPIAINSDDPVFTCQRSRITHRLVQARLTSLSASFSRIAIVWAHCQFKGAAVSK